MKNQKQVKREIRWLRRYVKWAINTFDKEKRPKLWYLFEPTPTRSWYTHIRNDIAPSLLIIYEEQHLITPEKHQTLLSQLNSPDHEDWYLALIVIDQINPHKT